MQPRLTRSASESMLSGVCGGLAEYFAIDPVLVRLIFVLLTLTTGLGLPVYLLLWLIMPRAARTASGAATPSLPHLNQESVKAPRQREQEVLVGQRQAQAQARSGLPISLAEPPERRFDPFTGQPIDMDAPATGHTVNLNLPPDQLPTYTAPTPRRAGNWRTLGLILVGIGGLILLEQFGIDMSLIFPALLIIAGIILMRRKR